MNTETNKWFTIADIKQALSCADNTARDLLLGLPYETRKNQKNHKMERIYHVDVIMPLCVKFKRAATPPKGHITLAEAATRAGIRRGNVYQLIHRGTLKYTFMGNGRKAVEVKSLEDYMASRTSSKMAKAGHILGHVRYMLNQLRPALYRDKVKPDCIAEDSRALLTSRINALTDKLNELKEIIA